MRNLWIDGPAGKIECMLRLPADCRGTVVLAHPHPTYGGTMHNPVIFHAECALLEQGWATLRFNFRGVGKSEGIHEEGEGEVADVGAALAWIKGLYPSLPQLLVGYSFGAWCGHRHLVDNQDVDGFVVVGLPVRIYSFDDIGRLGIAVAVVQGDRDEYGNLHEVRAMLAKARPKGRLYVIPGASHAFLKRAGDVASRVVEAVTDMTNGVKKKQLKRSTG